jgi:glycosyltransferase involved in cell wall biosynthesis
MQKPLISVIIPTYERPQFIIKACMTAYDQTYKNIEIIVIDDNSKASYENYFDEFSKLKVKYTKRDTNGGGSAARNTGIKMATGKYIAFLDDDDIWMESKLEKQINSLTNEIRASHCGYSLKSNNKTRIEPKSIIALDDLRENNKLASTSGLLCETKLLQQTMFDSSLHRSQDWDIYLRIAQFTSFSYIQVPLYVYDDGDHARMSNRFSQLS